MLLDLEGVRLVDRGIPSTSRGARTMARSKTYTKSSAAAARDCSPHCADVVGVNRDALRDGAMIGVPDEQTIETAARSRQDSGLLMSFPGGRTARRDAPARSFGLIRSMTMNKFHSLLLSAIALCLAGASIRCFPQPVRSPRGKRRRVSSFAGRGMKRVHRDGDASPRVELGKLAERVAPSPSAPGGAR